MRFLWSEVKLLVTQSCLTISMKWRESVSCSVTSSFFATPWTIAHQAHGLLQARILQWVSIPFSRGTSQPMDRTCVSGIAGRFFIIWATREVLLDIFKVYRLNHSFIYCFIHLKCKCLFTNFHYRVPNLCHNFL